MAIRQRNGDIPRHLGGGRYVVFNTADFYWRVYKVLRGEGFVIREIIARARTEQGALDIAASKEEDPTCQR